MNIYVLKLNGGKYYIGKSSNVTKRYEQHLQGNVSWTSKHKPEYIEKVLPASSPFDEDKITKEYMNIYGIDNVRGGSYVTVILDDSQRNNLQKEIWSANGACLRCGRNSHFINDCYANTDIHGNELKNRISCFYCGKKGHCAYDCSETSDTDTDNSWETN